MDRRPKTYLAGPEVFLPNAMEIGRRKKKLCAEFGFDGLFPFDNGAPVILSDGRVDRLIYQMCLAMIRAADGGVSGADRFI